MKKVLFFYLIAINCNIVTCQQARIYSLTNFNDNIECNLILYGGDHYYIELAEYIASDIIESLVISYGSYNAQENELVLLDNVHSFSMSLRIDKTTLKVNRAFKWLMNKEFVFKREYSNYESEFVYPSLNASITQRGRNNYECLHNHEPSLNYGVFRNDKGFLLNIQDNNKYIFQYSKTILSEGIWSKKGNELELYDTSLKHSFFVLIGDRALFSKSLPALYKDCRFDFDNEVIIP